MNNRILFRSTACRGATCIYPACEAGQVLVPFPGAGGSNYAEMFRWMNGTEGTPPFAGGVNPDPELRADLGTPLASSLDSIREWLTTATSSVGPGPGALAPGHALTDTRASCRQYNVILLTDGQESCDGDPPAAATALRRVCTNGGTWDMADMRCEIGGVPTNTSNVKVYVIGFGVGAGLQADLNAIAAAGGTGNAYFPANRAELTASLADIVARSLPVPRCDCDGTCDDEAAAFPDKGMTCSVGVGRCKRSGVFACNAAADGTVCSSTSAAVCPATPLVPGTPVMEDCGVAPGACAAPTPEDCADDDCDGQIDEGLSCLCRPEICNGLDDDCNGVVDDIPTTPCGLMVGICTAGTASCVPNGMGGASTVCQGGTGPQTEDCNGLDDNCNGIVDDVPARACFPTGFMGCTFNMTTRTFDCRGQCSRATRSAPWGRGPTARASGPSPPSPKCPATCGTTTAMGSPTRTTPSPVTSVTRRASRLHRQWRHLHLRGRVQARPAGVRCHHRRGQLRERRDPHRRGLRRQGQQLQRHHRRGLRRRAPPATTGSSARAARPGSRCATRWARARSATPARPRSATRSATATTTTATG